MELDFFASRHFRKWLFLDGDIAVGRFLEPGDRIEECRLSASGWTVYDYVLFRIYFQVGFLECANLVGFPLVVDDAEMVDGDEGFGHSEVPE